MGNENYIQNPELQNEQMKDENEVFNSFINVIVLWRNTGLQNQKIS